jgi:hypothetical protein
MMNKKVISALGLTLALILLGAGVAWAGTSTNYAIDWQVVNGGGQAATANNITLQGSIGQPLIGDAEASGGTVSLAAGYWEQATAVESTTTIYLPIVVKGD